MINTAHSKTAIHHGCTVPYGIAVNAMSASKEA
jgi:hypothetical protein